MRVRDDYRSLTGKDKAAVLMLSLGDEFAAKLFTNMVDIEIRELSQSMSELGTVSAVIVEQLFVEFSEKISSPGDLIGTPESTERLLKKVIGQERERLPGEHRAPVAGAPEAGEDEEPAQGVQTAVVEVVGRLGRRVGPRRARLVGGARLGALEEDARLGIVQERPVEDVRLGSHLTRDQEGEPSCSSSTFC